MTLIQRQINPMFLLVGAYDFATSSIVLIVVSTVFGGWIILRFFNYVRTNVRLNQNKRVYCSSDELIRLKHTTVIAGPLLSSNLTQQSDINYFKDKTLISREADAIIEQILDYVFRDYFFSWSHRFLPEKGQFQQKLATKFKNEIWIALSQLLMRLQNIDHVTFFTETVTRHLQRHFQKFNIAASQQIDENQHIVKFLVSRHLDDDRAELEFLRKICQFLLKILFPPNYANCDEFIFLLREILTCHVLFKVIDYICDPYFINHQAIVAGCVVGPTSPSPNIVNQPSQNVSASHENGSNYKQMEKHIDKTRSKIKEFKQKLMEKSSNSVKHADTIKIPQHIQEVELEKLKIEIHELECHLTRADLWKINIGAWLVDVHCVERWLETDEMLVIFLVYTDKSRTTTSTRSSSTGWITIRTLAEVCDQKRRFSKKIPALRKLDHPIFRRNDKGQSSTPQRIWIKELQQFFDLIIGCENIADSEELFLFLSPTPRHILSKVSTLPAITPKLSKLPFLPYFGVSPILLNSASSQNSKSKSNHPARVISIEQAYQNEYHLRGNPDIFFAEEYEQNSDIAEPIYDLICEIFELRGVQHWLRRTVILFFQVAFGKTINKQLKDCVSYISSESFTSTYLLKFRNSFWPDGKLAEPWPEVTEDDKKLTYLLAKQYLINNIPDVFVNILGQQNARKGFLKVFEALQNKKANKQLFYDILESFLYEFAPELNKK